MKHTWLGLLTTPLLSLGCLSPAGSHNASPELAATAEVDTTVGVKHAEQIDTTISPGHDLNVGGGQDSIALWLAVFGLVVQPATAIAGALAYQHILRPRRITKENGKSNGH